MLTFIALIVLFTRFISYIFTLVCGYLSFNAILNAVMNLVTRLLCAVAPAAQDQDLRPMDDRPQPPARRNRRQNRVKATKKTKTKKPVTTETTQELLFEFP